MKKSKKHKVYTIEYDHMFGLIPNAAGPIKFYNSPNEVKAEIPYWEEVGIYQWELIPKGVVVKADIKKAMKNAKPWEEWQKIRARQKKDPEYKEYLRLKKKFG